MPKYPFDQCFIITSSNSPINSSTVDGKLNRSITDILSLKYEAHAMRNSDDISDVSSYSHIINAPSSMSRHDMAALMAHAEVWQKIVEQDIDSALILEDTAVTNFDGSSLNTKLLEFYSAYSDQFDILYLGKCQDSCKQYRKAYDGVYQSQSPLCKYAYIITKDCAKTLLSELPSSVATDVFLSQAIKAGLRAYVFHPSIIRRNDLVLPITDDPSKSKAWRESAYRENIECKYEPDSDTDTWIPIAIIAGVIFAIIVLIILARRS